MSQSPEVAGWLLPCQLSPVSFPPQKYNADYDLSATQGADTLAFVSLLEEKLLPVLVSLSVAAGNISEVLGTGCPCATAIGCAGSGIPRGIGTGCPLLQIHTFWVDAKNYVEHTRKWYAETIPFPLNFFLPNCMHKQHVERLQLMWGDGYMEDEEKLEKEVRGCVGRSCPAPNTAAPQGLPGGITQG